jgi:phosphoglycerate dehydrogenase-like enzyme
VTDRSDDRPLVWVPFSAEELGPVPEELEVATVDLTRDVPDTVDRVRFLVPEYGFEFGVFDLLGRMPRLEVVQVQFAGVESVRGKVPEGVTLCNGRGVHDASTAELALTLTLASLRGIPGYTRLQDQQRWERSWRPALADRTVLVVGHGSIGQAIEERLRPFEANVVPVARTARPGVRGVEELPELLPDADVVILILPLTEDSRGLFDAEMIARMRPGALLVNVARGAVVDTDALVAACQEGRIGAALDVVDPEPLPPGHPLWTTPGVLLTPHVGGASSAIRPRALRLVREQLRRYAAGEPLLNVVSGAY